PLRTSEACLQDGAEALRLARQAGLLGAEAFAELGMSYALASCGEFGTSLAHVQAGLAIASEIGHRQWTAAAYCAMGLIYVLQLEPTFAKDVLATALALAQELGSMWWIDLATTYLARAYLLKNDVERAEAVLAAVLPREQQPSHLGEREVYLVWGELALAQGQADQALQIAEELLSTVPGVANASGEQPIPWLLRLQGEALLALGRVTEAAPVLEEAKRGALERQERSHLWYIHGLLARAYQQEEQARREGIAARNNIASLAATIDEPALREQFIHAAYATFWPREKLPTSRHLEAGQFGGLTEREREVAALLAQGKSNREIGDLLVVHYRTIETHVSNILSKLGFTSRAQIAVWAREKGLVK
ncbi:MAG: LuxR C-terminal-related transcriptional regulator, partial [Ktedonobacteraceae bacterium]